MGKSILEKLRHSNHTCLFIIFAILLSGCAFRTRISSIRDRPQKYQDEQVTIRGKVMETLSVQKGMYQMDDGTGKIWVISQKRVPFRGEKVAVKGKVKTGFTISERTFGTVIAEGEE